MLRTKDKSQRQRHVYISSRTYVRRSRTHSCRRSYFLACETSVSPLQVVSELVNSPRAVRCAFSTARRRFYCFSGGHFASSRRKSTPSAPSWYFVYGLAPFRRQVTYYAIGLLDRNSRMAMRRKKHPVRE